MNPPIERRLHRAAGVLLQYRETGQGPGLVLLHASPRSSAMFEPWMRLLAPHFHVLAIDTPGYGGSDPLAQPPRRLADYLPPLRTLMLDVLGPQPMVYGTATGAQLGIALANADPGNVKHLLIDNAAHFDDAERTAILERYFPDLSPRDDGSHLHAAWRMCAQMAEFFPWFADDEAHRIAPRAPPAAEVQASLAELLAAGADYALAYRAAFEHERAANVQALTVPTTLFRWAGSILLKHIDALIAHSLPAHVQVLQTPKPIADRYSAMTDHLLSLR